MISFFKMAARMDSRCKNVTQPKTSRDGVKPQFDKKKWRQDKYRSKLGNVKEGQGFADDRKRLVMHEYKRMLRNEQPQLEQMTAKVQRLYTEEADSVEQMGARRKGNNSAEQTNQPSEANKKEEKKPKMSIFAQAHLEHQKRVEESKRKKEKFQKDKESREKALQKYKEKKLARNDVLKLRTKKGQPIMRPRLQMLLEDIKAQIAKEKCEQHN